MADTQDEDESDEELQRFWDVWGMTYKEQKRFGFYLIAATVIIVAVVLLFVCLNK
jgi:hypothetical protein